MPDYKARVSLRSHLELDYHDRDGDHIGTLRLKESTLQWFGPNAKKYRSVSLEKFVKWIEDPATGAALPKF